MKSSPNTVAFLVNHFYISYLGHSPGIVPLNHSHSLCDKMQFDSVLAKHTIMKHVSNRLLCVTIRGFLPSMLVLTENTIISGKLVTHYVSASFTGWQYYLERGPHQENKVLGHHKLQPWANTIFILLNRNVLVAQMVLISHTLYMHFFYWYYLKTETYLLLLRGLQWSNISKSI